MWAGEPKFWKLRRTTQLQIALHIRISRQWGTITRVKPSLRSQSCPSCPLIDLMHSWNGRAQLTAKQATFGSAIRRTTSNRLLSVNSKKCQERNGTKRAYHASRLMQPSHAAACCRRRRSRHRSKIPNPWALPRPPRVGGDGGRGLGRGSARRICCFRCRTRRAGRQGDSSGLAGRTCVRLHP